MASLRTNIAVFAACITLARSVVGTTQEKPCDWLVAIFLEADGGLRASLEDDLRELTNASKPTSKCVNLIAQFDHLGDVQRRIRDWSRKVDFPLAQGVEMSDDMLDKYWRPIIGSDLHVENLWVEGALSNFVLESSSNYPSSKLALIVGSHGDAVRYFSARPGEAAGQEPNDGSRSLGTSARSLLNRKLGHEIELIVSKLPSFTSFEVVGLDACQLAAIEAEYEFSIASSRSKLDIRVVASQDNQDGAGWSYQKLFSRFDSVNTGADFASIIIAHAQDAWNQWSVPNQPFATLSHVQAAQVSGVADAMNVLGERLTAEANIPGNRLSILAAVQDARCGCRKFPGAEYNNAWLVDSACLVQQIASDGDLDGPLREAARTAHSRIELAVKATAPCKLKGKCGSGLSVFLPPPNASLSGYAYDEPEPPRFVFREGQSKAGGWATWIRYWASNVIQEPRKCGSR